MVRAKLKKLLAGTLAAAVTVTSALAGPVPLKAEPVSKTQKEPDNLTVSEDGYAGYLFAYFTGSSMAIHFAVSADGYHYTALNGNKAVVNQTVGRKVARDPYIIKGQNGDYYMLATDLKGGDNKTELDNKGNYVWGANDSIVTWHSTDLIHWDQETLITIRNQYDSTKADNQKRVWAPEAIWDAEKESYMIYWSMEGGEEYGDNLMIWYAYTDDFTELTSEPQVLYNPSPTGLNLKQMGSNGGTDAIDADIIENDGKFYMYYKWSGGNTAGINLAVSDTLTGGYAPLDYDPDEEDVQSAGELCGSAYVEGGDVYKLNGQEKWILIADHNWQKFYGMAESEDLEHWTDVPADDCVINFSQGDGNPKHGAVIPITAEQYEALWEEWGVKEADGTIASSTSIPHTVTSEYPDTPEGSSQTPVASFDFENVEGSTAKDTSGNNHDAVIMGTQGEGADQWAIKDGALVLNNSTAVTSGSGSGAYLELPDLFESGMDTMTISFDVTPGASQHKNFFTVAIGDAAVTCEKAKGAYFYGRVNPTQILSHITKAGWGSEEKVDTAANMSNSGKKTNLMYVFKPDRISVFADGVLVAEGATTIKLSDLGSELSAWLGKSFYSGDGMFNGTFDNIEIYDRALTDEEILEKFPQEAGNSTLHKVSVQGACVIKEDVDTDNKVITQYISRNNSQLKDLTNAAVDFEVLSGYKISGLKGFYNLEDGEKITISSLSDPSVKEEWFIQGVLCNNPALGGLYADPDIDAFNGKYYIYPTTDGFLGWNTQKFHVFSSDDLVSWKDEGVILDLSAGDVKWANTTDCYAWAPAIEGKNDKYYFYFCGRDKATNKQAIGVAVADSPTGPFVAEDEPLMTVDACKEAGGQLSQTIDPAIYTDEETGESYMLFGNGGNGYNIVKLNEDMISWDPETLYHYPNGTFPNFRESIHVFKKDGRYHFTWSCDDTGSENYSIRYAVADSLYPEKNTDGSWGAFKATDRGLILAKDPSQDILGTGHHCFLKIPGTEDYYIAYARFGTPLSAYEGDNKVKGTHREVCLEPVSFDEDGYIEKIQPTHTGITEPVTYGNNKEQEKDQKAADEVAGMINDLVKASAGDLAAAVKKAREAYDALTAEQKKLIAPQVKEALEKAEESLKPAKEDPKPRPAVVTKKPAAKGTVFTEGKLSFVVTNADASSPEAACKLCTDKKVKKITIPQTAKDANGITYKVTAVAVNAFKGTKTLKNVTLAKSIVSIEKNAFSGCTALKKIIIPAEVKTIGANAFKGDKNLNKIIVKSGALEKVGKNAFKGISKKAVIQVPKKQKKAYEKLFAKKGQAASVKVK
ncbi:MAG: hypothetical protein E7294_15775 [Lachnospiraceae bacterium]|nr:hypothetical protein [Lachnospiraceae bacterium]